MAETSAVTVSGEIKNSGQAYDHLVIRPNPASGKVFIDYLSTGTAEIDIRVYDVSGKTVLNRSIRQSATSIELDISGLEEGFYFLTLTDTGTGMVKTGKLIKASNNSK
jgi:hypothetical protein